jgi:hypothetical protein
MSTVSPKGARRLAQLVNSPGGITAAEAVQAAEARLDTIRASSLQEIEGMLDRMLVIGSRLAATEPVAACDELYTLSNSLVGVAGVFGMKELGEVAYSLCSLLDRQRLVRTWNLQAIQLHLDSLRPMFGDTADVAGRRAVIGALRQVVVRFSESQRVASE